MMNTDRSLILTQTHEKNAFVTFPWFLCSFVQIHHTGCIYSSTIMALLSQFSCIVSLSSILSLTLFFRSFHSHVTFPYLIQALWKRRTWGLKIVAWCVCKCTFVRMGIYYLGPSLWGRGLHRRIFQVSLLDDESTSSPQPLHALLTWSHTVI